MKGVWEYGNEKQRCCQTDALGRAYHDCFTCAIGGYCDLGVLSLNSE